MRKIQSTAVVRNVATNGTGVEFVHLKAEDRERLRRLVTQFAEVVLPDCAASDISRYSA